jgi:FkbM family methyltransferase
MGLDLVRRKPNPLDFLRAYDIRTVLDVGAYVGNFADEMRRILPQATIHCFEPQTEPFARLQHRFAMDRGVQIWNVALGDRQRSATMHVTASAACSSLLPSKLAHQYFEKAEARTTQDVQVTTLDTWAKGKTLSEPVLLKIDVQGLESEVLRGGQATLRRVQIMILEVSFEELYAGQPLFAEIHALSSQFGFVLHGMVEPLRDPRTGIPLSANAIFTRTAERKQLTGNQARDAA